MLSVINKKDLDEIADVETGLSNRMLEKYELLSISVEKYITDVSNKRIPKIRIRRILLNALLGYTKDKQNFYKNYVPSYVRVLAFDKKGQEILKKKKGNKFVFVTNMKKQLHMLSDEDRNIFYFEQKANRIYRLFCNNDEIDMKQKPFILQTDIIDNALKTTL